MGSDPSSGLRTHLDTRGCDALGNDKEAVLCTPGNENLSGLLVEPLGNLLDLGRVNHARLAGDVVAEGRVGGDADVFLLAWER